MSALRVIFGALFSTEKQTRPQARRDASTTSEKMISSMIITDDDPYIARTTLSG